MAQFSANTNTRGQRRAARREAAAAAANAKMSVDNHSLQFSFHPEEEFFAPGRMSVNQVRQLSHESNVRSRRGMPFDQGLCQDGPSLHVSDYSHDMMIAEAESSY